MMRNWPQVVFSTMLAFAAIPAVAQKTQALDYPTRPMRIIVGYAAGSGADITARVVGSSMSAILGQQFVIENRAGAGSSLAAAAVSRAQNDGYTLLLGSIGNIINAAMVPNLTFDFVNDFSPVALLTTLPQLLVVHPSLGVKTLKELIDLAKAKPDSISVGTAGGRGTAGHLTLELFQSMAGITVLHANYPGSPQAANDLLAGRVQAIIAPASTFLPLVKAGRIVALASTEAKRLSLAPDIPTVSEAGLPGFEVGLWFGLLAPAGTPPEVIDKLSRAANDALKSQDVAKPLHPLGYELVGNTPDAFRSYIDSEMKRWSFVVTKAGLKQ